MSPSSIDDFADGDLLAPDTMDLTVSNHGLRTLVGHPSTSQRTFEHARPPAVDHPFRNILPADFQPGSRNFVTPTDLIARQLYASRFPHHS